MTEFDDLIPAQTGDDPFYDLLPSKPLDTSRPLAQPWQLTPQGEKPYAGYLSGGPFSPYQEENMREAVGLTGLLKLPGMALEKIGEATGPAIADVLRTTGIDPSAEVGRNIFNIPFSTKIPGTDFSPLGALFGKEAQQGVETRGSNILSGFTAPEQLGTLGAASLSKPIQSLYALGAGAAVPETAQAVIEAKTPEERAGALTDFGENLAMGYAMGRGYLREPIDFVPETAAMRRRGTALPAPEPPPERPPEPVTVRKPVPQPERVPKPTVPETAPQTYQTVIEEARAKGADTVQKVLDLYPSLEGSREKARVIRDAAFPKVDLSKVKPPEVPTAEAISEVVPSTPEEPTPTPEPTVVPKVEEQTVVPPGPGTIGEAEMGAAGVREIGEGSATSLKNAIADAERAGLNLTDAPTHEVKNMAETFAKARQVETTTPGAGEALAKELLANPERRLTVEDSALLLNYKRTLLNKINDSAEATHVGDAASREAADALHKSLNVQLNNLLDSIKRTGTAGALEFRWRQALVKEDYAFQSGDELNRYYRSLSGRDMVPQAKPTAEKIAGIVKETNTEADAASTALREDVDKKAPPSGPDMVKAERDALDAANKTVRENAIRVAEEENKSRSATTEQERATAEVQRKQAQKALEKSQDIARNQAIKAARAEQESQQQVRLTDQAKASKAALDAASKAVRYGAKALADAENAKRERRGKR